LIGGPGLILRFKKLIAGPTVFICDECVRLCLNIIDGKGDADTGPEIGFGDHEPGGRG